MKPRGPETVTISARRRAWLDVQVGLWEEDGLVDQRTGSAILARYESGSRAIVRNLMITLGVIFLVVGVLSLVAANIEWARISPLGRFGVVAAVWLACIITAATLPGGPFREAAHLAAAGTYGAVVFQAAQSLQVPALSPGLLLACALGALAYAYATRSVAPLIVGIGALGVWYAMATLGGDLFGGGTGALLGTAVSGAIFTAVAALHRRGHLPGFAAAWRYLGALATVACLFVAALPGGSHRPALTLPLAAGSAVFLVVALAAVRPARPRDRQARLEMVAAGAAALAVLLLVSLPATPGDLYSDTLSGGQILRLALGSVFYLAYAIWVATVGAIRGNHRITGLATAALVIFVVVQSHGVFNELLSGGVTYLLVGLLLLGVAWGAGRGGRRLLASVGREPGEATAVTDRVITGEPVPLARRWSPRPLLGAVVVLQLVTLAVAVGPWLLPRLGGDEYRLAVEPVDPIDPFRGAYVALRFAGVPTYLEQSMDSRAVFMPLARRADGVWAGTATYRSDRPRSGPFLACQNQGGSVRCGIESLFASQDRAKDLAATLADGAVAIVRIDGAGRAAVIGLEAAPEPGGRQPARVL